jgi:hypothetical protein
MKSTFYKQRAIAIPQGGLRSSTVVPFIYVCRPDAVDADAGTITGEMQDTSAGYMQKALINARMDGE